jgi:hypothetical protein
VGTIAPDELYFILLKQSAWGSSYPSCSSTLPVHYFRDPNAQALFLIQSPVDVLQLAPKLLRGKTNLSFYIIKLAQRLLKFER